MEDSVKHLKSISFFVLLSWLVFMFTATLDLNIHNLVTSVTNGLLPFLSAPDLVSPLNNEMIEFIDKNKLDFQIIQEKKIEIPPNFEIVVKS